MFNLSNKKLYKPFSNDIDRPQIFYFLGRILKPESSFFWMTIIYGITITIFGLAIPVSVQFLVNSVVTTASIQPLIFISIILSIVLVLLAIISCLRLIVTEIFQRRFFTRITAEVGLKLLNANYNVFEEANQSEMVNRFFESITIQKSVPKFLTRSFTVIFQSIAGLVLVSFYHPIFLIFSVCILASLWFIWSKFYFKTQVASFYEGRRKYDIAAWLEEIARGNVSFKSKTGYDYAQFKLNFLSSEYLNYRKQHFKGLFSQVVALSAVYVIGSVILLVIGGLLVLKEQLTIGQLVAAELVLSTMFYGVLNLGKDFENFYDLVAACEKLSQFYNIPSDKKGGKILPNSDHLNISLNNVSFKYLDRDYLFNLHFESGKNYLISAPGFSTKKVFSDLLRGLKEANSGEILINEIDIESLDKYELRDQIYVVKNADLLEGNLDEFLSLKNEKISEKEIFKALEIVGLDEIVKDMKDGLSTRVIPSGWPFSESEKILLQLARVIIHRPKLIILTEVFDSLEHKSRAKILNYLMQSQDIILIYFSNQIQDLESFDEFIYLDKTEKKNFQNAEDLRNFIKNK